MISVYQKTLAPLLPTSCRYYPSCSHYSQEAVGRYGVFRGVWLSVKRLGRCRPLGGQGYDPVP
ncbi:MAG: membrane protein insertion efficiency factor YidD [Dehalococcoidia bacterium]|nr:membrane protein insertion efficiency factor YidD [Dehalococcoidia bacterium]